MHTITLIPGDGTGPEIVEAAKMAIEATGVDIHWEIAEAGEEVMKKYGTPLPSTVIESIRKNRVALKGPVTTPVGTGYRSVNVALRQELDLFACVRPCKLYPGVKSFFQRTNVDLVIIRENTEDLYCGVEHWVGKDAAESIKIITRRASERIARFAFDYALREKRRKVTAVTKANILKYTDGLFLECARKVATSYPQIEYEERLVDNMCMQLVQKPSLYDVLVLPNLYGDIISDLGAGLIGGLGMAPGANFGDQIAVFEAVHGSAPRYKGLNKVNPAAVIFSAIMMLKHIGEKQAADRLLQAATEVIREGKKVTYDLGGNATTFQMAEAIAARVRGL